MTEYEAHKSYLTKHIVSNEGLILKCVLRQPMNSYELDTYGEHKNWTCNKCGWGIDNEDYIEDRSSQGRHFYYFHKMCYNGKQMLLEI